ncbi:MAG: hypothetical protein KGL39_55525, partial [Patescibacteria group bacterium]|nr:hypothetical protein [Patescibacteria group bacterium]
MKTNTQPQRARPKPSVSKLLAIRHVAHRATGSEFPTPRSDELRDSLMLLVGKTTVMYHVEQWLNHSKELERELIAANGELDAIRAVFQHGADEESWKPGTSLAEAVAKLKADAGLPNVCMSHGGHP